jgi:uncharacterized protein YcbK (DUF882 family)
MSVQGATLLVMRPGRETLRIELSQKWPYQLLGTLLLPILMGAAGGFGWRKLEPQAHAVAAVPARARPAAQAAGHAALPHPLAVAARAVAAQAPGLTGALVQPRPQKPATQAISAQPIVRAFRVSAGRDDEDALGLGSFLRLGSVHLGESVRVQPFEADGTPRAEAFAALSHLMRCRVTGEEIAIDPRLVRVLAQLAALYTRPIQLISGYRAAHTLHTSETSQHSAGRAADVRIAGISIEELRQRAIELGAGGVGLYPEKGFVHVDVRSRPHFRWVYTEAGGEQPYDRYMAANATGNASPADAASGTAQPEQEGDE